MLIKSNSKPLLDYFSIHIVFHLKFIGIISFFQIYFDTKYIHQFYSNFYFKYHLIIKSKIKNFNFMFKLKMIDTIFNLYSIYLCIKCDIQIFYIFPLIKDIF